MEQTDKIIFETDEGPIEFYIVDETRISGRNYILVTDSKDEEAEALILKDVSSESDKDAIYEIVDDDVELMAVAKVFEESLEDVKIE